MKWIKKNIVTILLVAIFLAGLGLIIYPSFADYWNSFHQARAIMNYASDLSKISDDDYKQIIESAQQYNADLAATGIKWDLNKKERKKYMAELNAAETGVMGYIDIPKINVRLPIYHGTGDDVLQTSIGHLEGTSLPVGGEASHCVLSGHRGLPSARLFTDLDKLVVGDSWTMHILNETLTYEVDQIRIVEPHDLSALTIQDGKDFCTLVTCTPYGINTHRLLVRGHRIENAHGEAAVVADALQIEPIYIAPFLAVPVLVLLVLTMLITTGIEKRHGTRHIPERYLKEKQLEKPDLSGMELPDVSVLEAARKRFFH